MRRRRVLLLVAVVLAGLLGWFVVEWKAAQPQDVADISFDWFGWANAGSDTVVAGGWEYTAIKRHEESLQGIVVYPEFRRRPLTLMARLRDWWEGE